METTVDHYPTELTKAYFEERIPADQIDSILGFLEIAESKHPEASTGLAPTAP